MKSVMGKKICTHTHTHKFCYGKDKNYIPPIYLVWQGFYNNFAKNVNTDCFSSTGAGSGGGSLFTQHHTSAPSISSPWLSIDSSRNKMEIFSLLPNQNLPVNTLDIESQTLICGTDEEAIYAIDLPAIR